MDGRGAGTYRNISQRPQAYDQELNLSLSLSSSYSHNQLITISPYPTKILQTQKVCELFILLRQLASIDCPQLAFECIFARVILELLLIFIECYIRKCKCKPIRPNIIINRTSMQRQEDPKREEEKKEAERNITPNLLPERQLKKRLPPPLKQEQQKGKRKEEVTPKQEEFRNEMPRHKMPTDRPKDISPHPNADYHTVSISQRNKQSKDSAHQQTVLKKDERDTRMRKKNAEGIANQLPLTKPLVTSLKKQASPSQEKQS